MDAPLPVSHVASRWTFYCFLTLVGWLPILVSSGRAFSRGLLEIVVFGLLSSWLLSQAVTRKGIPHFSGRVRTVLLLLLTSLAYQLLQVAPLPLDAIRLLSPGSYEVFRSTQPDTTRQLFSVSLDIGLSLEEFLKSAAYFSMFFLTLVLVDSRKRLQQLAYLLVLVGFGESLFGLLDASVGGALFRIPVAGVEGDKYPVTGTYANYNHLGGLLEMAIPVAMAMIMAQTRDRQDYADWRTRMVALSKWLLSRRPWLYLGLLAMITALLLSTSRGAVISLFSASGLMLGMAVLKRGGGLRQSRLLILLATPLVVGVWLGSDQLFSRLEKAGLETDRHLHREIAYRIMADYPVFGIGSGNWIDFYPAYQTPESYTDSILSNVHNDYLELLVEQGIVGFLIFGSAILIALVTMIDALRRRRDPLMRGVLYGTATATISLLIHALVEFNFHVTANAAWFSVILAMGLITSRMPHDA